ncbi:hypothetical protein Barb4_00286 [Bacteroidales bacterium Barb4]|nr:hypothetical protein Barb4_00286 [Bacteroidales bacterium Barb4]
MVTLKVTSEYYTIRPRWKVEVLDNITQKIMNNLEAYNIKQSDYVFILAILSTLIEKVELWESPSSCTAAVRQDLKDYMKETDKQVVKWITCFIMNNPYITGAQRVDMGLPPYPHSKPVPVPAPEQRVSIGTTVQKSGRVKFRFFHDPEVKKLGKPAGVAGCEFCYARGENLTPEECVNNELITRCSIIREFDRADWNHLHTAYGRWYNAKGELGPWSLPVTFVPVSS